MREAYSYQPYSLLEPQEFEGIVAHLSSQRACRGEVLLIQEISEVTHFRVVISGSARFYFEFNFNETLKRDLRGGDSFGGVSILLNEGIATKTLRVLEDSTFLCLDAHHFLALCRRNERFTEYFTNAFGKSMINRTYAGIISRQIKDKELNLPFFNQPVSAMYRPVIAACRAGDSIAAAARMMARGNSSALLVSSEAGIEGIVTDADLRERVLAAERDLARPVAEIMSSPIISIRDDSQVYQVFLEMIDRDVRHLMLINRLGDITGVITEKDLITAQANSTYLLIKTVKSATNINQLENIHARLTRMLLTPIRNGSSTEYITKLITAFSDAIIDKVVSFALAELGQPPCPFVFMIMGSEGREEQTFVSDQDNAIVYGDPRDADEAETARRYFATLADAICGQLDVAGYKLCAGGNMAKNPQWCQPLAVWKRYFHEWTRAASPRHLLHSSIFFDFRGVWGDLSLADGLKDYLLRLIDGWPGFLRNLSENTLQFKPPLRLFGRFAVLREGDHKGCLDIKLALLPIVDFARVYALRHGVADTNTLVRLFKLHKMQVLDDHEFKDMVQIYNYLMHLRFMRQITVIIDQEREPDNYLDPTTLSSIDQAMLKAAIRRIGAFQQRMRFDFSGMT